MKQRVVWIDYLKGLGMLLVVLYHTQPEGWLFGVAQIPKLASFFLLAGMFASGNLIKTKRLFIPYLSFGLISFFFWLILRNFGADACSNIAWWKPLWGLVVGTPFALIQYPPLWFLTCLMVTEVCFCVIHKINQPILQAVIVIILAACGTVYAHFRPVLPWCISSALVMLPFYWVGNRWKDQLLTLQPPIWLLFVSMIGSLGLIIVMYLINGYINVSQAQFGNIGYAYLAMGGTFIFLCSLSQLLLQLPCQLRLLSFIGKNSLIYLVTHVTCFSLIKGFAVYIFRVPIDFFSNNIGCILLWICSLFLIVPIAWLIRRYCPFLIGSAHESNH